MKQKILYILMMITALLGGNGEAWAQSGYTQNKIEGITYTFNKDALKKGLSNGRITIKHSYSKENISYNTTFTIGDNVKGTDAFGGLQLKKESSNTFLWSTEEHYIISLNKIEIPFYNTITGGKINFTASSGKTKEITGVKNESTQSFDGLDLPNDGYVILKVDAGLSRLFYIRSVTYTYNIFYYELDVYSLESAINTASNASKDFITDETMKSYLNAAIENANSFKAECAFPKSYWNGSSVGKTPAEVTSTAEKLNAITNYLIARTNASVYQQDDIPNEIYRQLHQYDEYDPNGFDSGTINTAKADIDKAITLAANTTEAYKSVKSAIATAAARTDHIAAAALEADVTKATNELEAATTVDAINAALANIKNFDNITFNGPFSVDEGATIDNPANAASRNIVAYSSSDPTVMSVDGTTLRALKPGTVTITAITDTGNGYYAYKASETYIINATAFALDSDEGNLPTVGVEYPTITLNRSLSGICTLALPFDTHISDFSDSPDAYAAQLALVTYNKADGYTLYFMKVDGGHMSANEPYVICLPSTKDSFVWADVTIDSVDPLEKGEGENESFQGWTMQANYTPGVSMEGKYGIAGGKLCLGGAKSTINAYTAYFIPPGGSNASVRMAVLEEDGGVTYIDDIRGDGEEVSDSEEIYRLDGTKHTTLTKGINIVKMANGEVRKVLK